MSSRTEQQAPDQRDLFLSLVDFKWLMAGSGWLIDLSRLQRDSAYADQCLQRGLVAGCELLRRRSAELMALLARSDAHHSAPFRCAPSELAL